MGVGGSEVRARGAGGEWGLVGRGREPKGTPGERGLVVRE